MEFDGNLDIRARELEDLKKSPEELTRQAAMRWADSQLDPLLPQPPFFLHLVGGIGKGKTTIILNMLQHYQKFNTFCKVYYLSPSGKNDPKLRMFLSSDNEDHSYSQENLQSIIKEIKEFNSDLRSDSVDKTAGPTPIAGTQGLSVQGLKQRIQTKVPPTLGSGKSAALSGLAEPKTAIKTKEDLAREARKKVSCRTLIIADDATGTGITKRDSPFTQFLVSIRHENTSVILSTHSDTSLAHQLRSIVTAQILFEPGNDQELKNISMDIGGVNVKQLAAILGHVRKVPHGFLFVDKKRPFEDRFILNFKNRLDPAAFAVDGPKGTTGAAAMDVFRNGGFLPTPAEATASEAKFADKAYALQQEAILLNQGITPAEKIVAEQNAAAKRKRDVEASTRTSTAKAAQHASIARSAKAQRQDDAIRINSSIRAAAFKRSQAARLTQPSRSGGVLDAKFQRGLSRNVAIATGGRRGIGGRGRRSAAALGPLAQQLEENIKLQQDLKAQKDALSKDEEARKAEAASTDFAPGEVGPFLPDESLINQHARDNPPPLPPPKAFAQPTPGLFPLRGQPSSIFLDQVANSAKTFQERAAAQRAAVQQAAGAAAHGALMNQLKNELPPRTEDSIFNATQQTAFVNEPLTQADAAAEAALEPMNTVDTEANDDPGPQEGSIKRDPANVPLPPSPVPDPIPAPQPTPMEVLAPANTDSFSGPNFGSAPPPEPQPLNAPSQLPFGPVATKFTSSTKGGGVVKKNKKKKSGLESFATQAAEKPPPAPLNQVKQEIPLTANSAVESSFAEDAGPGPTSHGGQLKRDLSGKTFEEERLQKRQA